MADSNQADRQAKSIPTDWSANYFQANRPLTLTTPLGPDDLLPIGFQGFEAISQLFTFHLDLIAENQTAVPFERLLGEKVALHLALLDGKPRHFSGICKSIREGVRDPTFTAYQMVVVPQLWLLGKRAQSRIFQQMTVPDILRVVLSGLDVVFEIQGTFNPRDYCVQYRETDLNFASRLMEEEGLAYFFKHSANGHTMVVTDNSGSWPALADSSPIVYGTSEQGLHGENRISSWAKTQELRSGLYTLWDHCFELPHKHLEATQNSLDSVAAGQVTHKLRIPPNAQLELYDYPGEYAQRFDGVSPGGGDRSADLDHIFTDNQRTTGLRMQEEAAHGLVIQGSSMCRGFMSGSRFVLDRHFNANGTYLLTQVRHSAGGIDSYRSGGTDEFVYENSFTCIPFDLPFRPSRTTPKPTVHGTQTAVVVGPAGEEIFTDKYSRVKVQFHWDRQGKNDANSSCWVRVGTAWAGKSWGAIHIPRVGQEVLVDFLEGDPDRPIIVGSVYNADTMPPYALPDKRMISGVKSHSYPGGPGYNEFVLDDTKGNELIRLHAQYDKDATIEHDLREHVLHDRSRDVTHDETVKIGNDQTLSIGQDRSETVGQSDTVQIGTTYSQTAGTSITLTTGLASITMNSDGTITIQGTQINLITGDTQITLDATGITMEGMMIDIEADVQATLQGLMTQISADAMLQTQAGITMMS